MIDPGTMLEGRYRVVRLLGEGAMGAVYEAERTAIGRRVAVKVLHQHFIRHASAVSRFAAEARAAGAIGHPNIVEVLDFGTHEGVPFIVMEILRGETLAERMARVSTLDPAEACAVTGHILSALASAHAAGIVHRDLKPENVFLATRGGTAFTVKLLDFGVSKFRRADAPHVTTQDGMPVGTPSYMAPEQWMGRRDTDHRADLFAAGVILYEMLTGGLPYEGETQGELFLEVVQGTAAPPEPGAIAPGVPPALDPIVLRAVERDRAVRFPTAQAFLDALRPHGAGDIAVVADPPAPALLYPEPPPETSPGTSPGTSAGTSAGTFPARVSRAQQVPTFSDHPSEAAPILPMHRLPRTGIAAAASLAALALAVTATTLARRHPASASTTRAVVAARWAPARPEPATSPPVGRVRVELRGLPDGAVVDVDGVVQRSAVLLLDRTPLRHAVTVTAGAVGRSLEVQADRDQVLVIELPSPGVASVGRGLRHHRPGADARPSSPTVARPTTRPATGIGALDIAREF